MLNQAAGDRQILAKQLGISSHQLSYVTQSGAGESLLFYGDMIIPFVDRFPKDTELYSLLAKLVEMTFRAPLRHQFRSLSDVKRAIAVLDK